jgi:hypothetical protein
MLLRVPLLLVFCSIPVISQDPLAAVRTWLPSTIGDRWIYEAETRDGDRQHPDILRWRQQVVTVAIETIPEGILIRRKVTWLNNTAPPRWIGLYDESNILIRNNCAWYLADSPQNGIYAWDRSRHTLSAEFRKFLASGETLPDVCFPLQAGKTWGDPKKGRDLWTVAGHGTRHPGDPDSATRNSWRLEAELASGDNNYVWFKKGVGISGSRTVHNGTYHDDHVRLVRFEPASRF